jgi:thioredoxin-related protein
MAAGKGLNRRGLLAGGAALVGLGWLPRAARAQQAPQLNEDGLYEEPWFVQSFLDLRDDLATAHEEGKRFAVMFELKGCPYCKETHLVNFADPEIRAFVQDNFVMLQLNIIGARMVTDFDGEELSERDLAQKWGVRFTPTTCFYPEDPADVQDRPGHEIEVARMPGYFRPPHFLAMYRFVREKAYATTDFRQYLKAQAGG